MKKIISIILLAIIVVIIISVNKNEEVAPNEEINRQIELIQIKDEYRDSVKTLGQAIQTKDKDLITVSLSKLAAALEKLEIVENVTTDEETKEEISKIRKRGGSVKTAVEEILNNSTEEEITINDTIIEELDSINEEVSNSIENDIQENPEILEGLENMNIDLENENSITTEEDIMIEEDNDDSTITENEENESTEQTETIEESDPTTEISQ